MKKIFTSYNIIIHFFLLATTEHKEDFGWQAIFGSDNPEQLGIISVQQDIAILSGPGRNIFFK
jgi:hypothetical protein